MKKIFFLITIFPLFLKLHAQNNDTLIKEGLKSDSLFWDAYNKCSIDGMMRFIPKDVEFYHDKGGKFIGSTSLKNSFEKNLCGNKDFRLRREAINSTVRVYPMKDKDKVYGLIISGDHYFYINETGKKEYRDGLAKFTDFWMLENGEWKMSRILSYNHGPAPYLNEREEVTINSTILNTYKGKYSSSKNGVITIQPEKSGLSLLVGNNKFILYPETSNRFFMKERDLIFEFVKENGKVSAMKVYENGNLSEEDKKLDH